MFKEKDFYCYNGLFIDQDSLDEAGIKKITGFELMILLQSYEEVYTFSQDVLTKKNKTSVSNFVNGTDSRDKEFCYIIKGNKVILPEIDIYYGIARGEQLLAYYSEKSLRGLMLSKVKQYNINPIISDMGRSQAHISEYNRQQKLIKTYKKLKNIGR